MGKSRCSLSRNPATDCESMPPSRVDASSPNAVQTPKLLAVSDDDASGVVRQLVRIAALQHELCRLDVGRRSTTRTRCGH